MRSPRDPIRTLKVRLVLIWTLGVGAILGCAWWAKKTPVPIPTLQPPPVAVLAPVAETTDTPLDMDVFSVSLWNLPEEEPPPAPVRVARPAPIPLELLAIVNNPQRRYVALYDLKEERVVIANEGDQIGDWTLSTIAEAIVQLRHGERLEELRLQEDPG